MALRKRLPLLIASLAAIVVFFLLTSGLWLTAIGMALVHDDPPDHADAAIVLAGDSAGSRILKACDLARQGLAPVILVSGPMAVYGVNEADLAVRFAVQNGCRAEWLHPVYNKAMSTADEAREFAAYAGSHPEIRSVLLVTSNYHTARSARLFQKQMGERVRVTTVAAPDRYFSPDGWWHNREGQKTAFLEVSKTVATWIGL